jgi:hypothetical protein
VFYNGQVIPQSAIPVMSWNSFSRTILDHCSRGFRLISLFGAVVENKNKLHAVLADDSNATLHALSAHVKNSFPTMTNDCPQSHLFEREIFEQMHIQPVGHPWLKPVRFPGSEPGSAQAIGDMNFFRVSGDTIHEVAVGPVHASIWKSRWAISIVASKNTCTMALTKNLCRCWKPWLVTRASVTPQPIAWCWKHWPAYVFLVTAR